MKVSIATKNGESPAKVVVIPSWYPSEDAPLAGIFVREQAACLARQFDVTVLTPRFPPLRDQLALRWGPEIVRERAGELQTWRVRYLKTPTLRRWISFLSNPDHVFVYYRKFAAAIRHGFARLVAEQGRPDLIHAHVVLPAGAIAAELAHAYGIPFVLTEHSGPFSMHLQTPRQRQTVREVLQAADRLIAVSPALRDAMLDFCPDVPIDVVGNMIDTDFFGIVPNDATTRKPFRFLYVGLFAEIKGVRYLLEAAANLVARGVSDFEIYLGGAGPLLPNMQALAASLGIVDRCRFLGMLDRAAVRNQMQACDVFVLPSLGETFGIVLGEAMACGKPVLSTRCGGPEYIVTPEAGVLVTPGNRDELADAIAQIFKHETVFEPNQVRTSAVDRFGPTAFRKRTAAVYDSLRQDGMAAVPERAAKSPKHRTA